MTVTRASFRGGVELRQETSDDAISNSPTMEKLSPADRVATVTHLAHTLQQAGGHAFVHAKASAQQAARLRGKVPGMETLQHNAAHAANHVTEVVEHAKKLEDHLKAFPSVASAASELQQVSASKTPSPPKGRG